MRKIVRGVLGLAFLFTTTGSSLAMCDPSGADAGGIADAQANIAANCNCATATSHGAYVSCAAGQAQGTSTLNPSCRGKVVSCAARSTCGKPGFVLCCRTNATGTLKCSTKLACTACNPPSGGSACCSDPANGGQTSCCGPTGVEKTGVCSDPSCVATP